MERQIIWNQEQTWTLEGTQMEVEVILASQGPEPCPPIYTLRMRYPRIIHAEAKTHRVFSLEGHIVEQTIPADDVMGDRNLSRNARSSRAVPVKTMLEEIRNDPFVPWHWGKNQRGMQADESFDLSMIPGLVSVWQNACWDALTRAEALERVGVHKQIVNRLLEPFMWIDVLVTSTEWENFLWLRNHEAAEPHLQDLARLVEAALDGAEVQYLEPGQWHLPYITYEDRMAAISLLDLAPGQRANSLQLDPLLCKISAARCARISYKPFDGDASYERELERYDSLVSSDRVHASPLEHQATPDREEAYLDGTPTVGWVCPRLHGNFTGWIQYRKTVPGENHAG